MASGIHNIHPEKDASIFLNEVGITPAFKNQGIGRELVKYWETIQTIGFQEATVVSEKSNIPALGCYLSAGWEPIYEGFTLFGKQVYDQDQIVSCRSICWANEMKVSVLETPSSC